MRFLVELEMEAEHQYQVRDLVNAVQEGIRSAQKAGRYAEVTVTSGPSIGTPEAAA